MKSIPAGQYDDGRRNFREGVRHLFVLSLIVLSIFLYAAEVKAAHISFEPNGVMVNVIPGEFLTIPVTVSLSDTSTPNTYARFSLAHVDGTLNRTWINGQPSISLNSWYKTRQAMLHIRVPANAKDGAYTGVFRTVWLRSNEQIDPADLIITVEVGKQLSCNQAPMFSAIISSQESINARNNKEVAIDLSGSVAVSEGCDIDHAWYQLIDEYGELDMEGALTIDDDGVFSVAVPMIASRKGNDKDGRLYTVKFMAENEAGVGASDETSIVVLHDNRKK